MKIKTADLTGAALAWVVGTIEQVKDLVHDNGTVYEFDGQAHYRPDVLWAQGGQIIDRERICVNAYLDCKNWNACVYIEHARRFHHEGATPLIAAMRCLVAFKLGDEVDVPDELVRE